MTPRSQSNSGAASAPLARAFGRALGAPGRLREAGAKRYRRWYFSHRFPGVEIDKKTRIGRGCQFVCDPDSVIRLHDCRIGPGSMISATRGGSLEMSRVWIARDCVVAAVDRIVIEEETLLGEFVTIRDHDHDRGRVFVTKALKTEPIAIGANVWIGAKATILKGVTIPAGTVIGANSVVTRPIAAGGVYGGVPARALKLDSPTDE